MILKPLTEFCTVNMGQSPDSKTYNDHGNGIPFYQGNADFGEIHPETRVWCSAPVKIAEAGDILISVRAPIGAMNIAVERCCIGRGLAALTPISEKCGKQFLYYALQSKVESLIAQGTGSTFKAISKKVLEATLIPAYSTREQEQITATISHVYRAIAARRDQLVLLDQLVKSRFIELFGDPIRNEKGWPIVTLGEVAEIRIGPFGSLLHKEDYIVGGHALVNPSHIIDGNICTDDKLTVSDEKYEELSAYRLSIGDLILGRRGEMGRCAVVYEDGLLCGTGSIIIRPKEKMKPYFLQNIISSPGYKRIIEDKAVGVTMMNLNVPIVSSLTIPLLPIDMQEQFIAFMQQTDKSKMAVQQGLQELEILKKSLMQQYFG